MELGEFAAAVPDFDALSDREKIRHFGWYLHTHRKMETFATGDVRKCFEELRLVSLNISLHLTRMSETKPPALIRTRGKYKLHRTLMMELDGKYGDHPATIEVSKLLAELSGKVPDLAERVFLEEAISCYRVKAFRAAIVMAWNLAYDHLIHWVFADPARIVALNGAFAARFQKKAPTVSVRRDVENIKEIDVVEACGTAHLVSSNVVKILKEKLSRRNIAAHPSSVVVSEPQANDVITDLVNNVVLELKYGQVERTKRNPDAGVAPAGVVGVWWFARGLGRASHLLDNLVQRRSILWR
jgi:hypothetical protein